ncbi:hypothetical protein HII36_36855 [Nonomuraea sp. NN258]|uniref:hypothetical protein n=1 Tax=Nonomuraea antri TaxID=2730852 RepID=UPI0015698620|nr:hypothetical protein [Nonomuraea antri]NRQ37367.1 hypothetical protein [Nonomuraea antri]
MSNVCVAGQGWSALLAARLLGLGVSIGALAPGSDGVRRLWSRLPGTGSVQVLDGDGPAAPVKRVLLADDGPVPPWVTAEEDPAVVRLVIGLGDAAAPMPGDALRWAILSGAGELPVRLTTVDRELRQVSSVAVSSVPVSGLGYAQAAERVAEAVAGGLESVGDPSGDGRARHPFAGRFTPAAALDIDWAAPAERIVRLVRAGIPELAPTRTWVEDVELFPGRARVLDGPALLPPGTITAGDSAEIVVSAGDGLVGLSEIRDVIGPIGHDLLPPGRRLGLDQAAELVRLRRRVRDLEEVARWLAEDRRP